MPARPFTAARPSPALRELALRAAQEDSAARLAEALRRRDPPALAALLRAPPFAPGPGLPFDWGRLDCEAALAACLRPGSLPGLRSLAILALCAPAPARRLLRAALSGRPDPWWARARVLFGA